ncbi:MAG: rod shape-determining protein MreC [Alphaproteobacteria bacterium]|nr:rod shape-determining protein MreC [Alphaproteobacteria bacterium]
MSVHTRRTGWVYTTALSWRVMAQRFSFVLFMVVSLGILILGHTNPTAIERIRVRAVDGLAPVFDVLSRPMAMVDSVTTRIQSYRGLLLENEKLRAENENLVRWQNAVLSLQSENKELRGLLNYKAEPQMSYISARVIADTGGAFVRAFIVTAGRVDGVREGMAAMTGEGLIGRVVEVGDWTSRIILITDMNSRIPVMLMGSGDHAILAGENAPQPDLLYLPQDADIKVGMRVMTSGHGGVFPPNIPVGIVASVEHGKALVSPLVSLSRINQVRLIDFNLAAGALNPIAAKLQTAASSP